MRSNLVRRGGALRLPTRFTLAALALAVAAGAPAAAQDECKGRNIRSLGGAHAVSRKPIKDVADLQKRLPDLEATMREMVARDGSIGAGTADALFAAIRAGNVTERKLGRNEPFRWMIFQPKKGTFELIQPPCVNLLQDYDAFEIVIEVPEPPPAPPDDAKCNLSVTRNCERQSPTFTVDAAGSSAGATVEHEGQALAGAGPRWTVSDTTPYSEVEKFTVKAKGTPPEPQMARVYKFLIPKACSNLAYLGEGPRKVIGEIGWPKTCEKSVDAPMCKPWAEVSVEPSTVEVHDPATVKSVGGWHDGLAKVEVTCAEGGEPMLLEPGDAPFTAQHVCCGHEGYDIRFETKNAAGDAAEAKTFLNVEPHDWIFRGSLAYIMPTDGTIGRDFATLAPFGVAASEEFEIEDGPGVSLALERRFNEKWGLEFGGIFGQVETGYELTVGSQSGEYELSPKMYALTVGPNFHLLGCGRADLYLGPFIGYGGLYDPNYWVLGHRFHADFSADFLWGLQLGLDVPFDRTSDWGIHGGLRYFVFDQDTDAGSVDVDPLVFELGLAYHF